MPVVPTSPHTTPAPPLGRTWPLCTVPLPSKEGENHCTGGGAAPATDLNAFLSPLASEATIPSPDTDRMCLSANLDLAEGAPSKQKYFCKVLEQGGSMKYEENLNSRFLMQNIYHLYQK